MLHQTVRIFPHLLHMIKVKDVDDDDVVYLTTAHYTVEDQRKGYEDMS